MRFFRLNHGLHAEPESQDEANVLVALVEPLKFTDRYGNHRELRRKPATEFGIFDSKMVPDGSPTNNKDHKEGVGRRVDVV